MSQELIYMHFNLNRVLIYLGILCLCYFQVSMAIRFHTSHFKCHNHREMFIPKVDVEQTFFLW